MAGWKPDISICDIGMPEEDGYSFIRKVRALGPQSGGGVAAIALTGYVRVENEPEHWRQATRCLFRSLCQRMSSINIDEA